MTNQLKIYAIGFFSFSVGLLAFLINSKKLKTKTIELKIKKNIMEIDRDVNILLANRNIIEVLDRVDKEIINGELSDVD